MAEVRGFRGLRYAQDRVGSLDDVITPPYDVISPEERRILAMRSPYNLAHVILPEDGDGEDRYTRAGRLLDHWITEGVIRQDAEESFYLLEQEFKGSEAVQRVRRAFFGITKLPEPGERVILGHEKTLAGPLEDRLRLIQATRANLGAVFALYADEDQTLRRLLGPRYARNPDAVAHTIDGVAQRLWQIPYDPRVTEFLRDKKLYIADGHHRFATARTFRDTTRKNMGGDRQPFDYVLMGFVAFEDPGLVIYPPHRLIDMPPRFDASKFLKSLEKWFVVSSVDDDLPRRVEAQAGCALGVAVHGAGQYLLVLRDIDRVALLGDDCGPAWRDLDVAVLHRGIIERLLGLDEATPLVYERFGDRALKAVAQNEKALAFFLKAVRPDQLRACAESEEPMPPKSTYFFPKLPSGAVIHRLR